ncbi:MAG TPA: TetR/AcrR family transcriptional regulator [Pseudonocardiaceae bacterium]|nr:TetR/AcrR family transcriptional regulator [Pseudonocardiaceae bacterium]
MDKPVKTSEQPRPPWQRSNQRKPARVPITQELIVDTALAVLAEEGLEAATMRRVAQGLATGPASLYAHVSNKEELHELMADRVLGEVPLPEVDPAAWRAQLKALLTAQFAALVRYPGIAKVVMAIMIPAGPNLLKLGEVMLALLRAGGLSERQAAYGCDIAGTYVKAVAQESSEWRSGLADRPDMRRRAAALSSYLGALPPGTFPYMNAVNELFSAETAGERFEFGLDVMLDGLAARAERSGGSE